MDPIRSNPLDPPIAKNTALVTDLFRILRAMKVIISLLIVCFITHLPISSCQETVITCSSVKVVDGIDKISDKKLESLSQSQPTGETSTISSGPEILSFLNGLCFTKQHDRFDYTFCPYHNVTQKRLGGIFERPASIGYWSEWLYRSPYQDITSVSVLPTVNEGNEDVTSLWYGSMAYLEGQQCRGTIKTSTIVKLKCNGYDNDFEILDIRELNSCEYELDFNIPLSCDLLAADRLTVEKEVAESKYYLNRAPQPVSPSPTDQSTASTCVCPTTPVTAVDETAVIQNSCNVTIPANVTEEINELNAIIVNLNSQLQKFKNHSRLLGQLVSTLVADTETEIDTIVPLPPEITLSISDLPSSPTVVDSP